MRTLKPDDVETDELRSMIHNLAGAAGTFGYPALSAAAMAIDDVYAAGARPDPSLFAALEAELVRVVAPE